MRFVSFFCGERPPKLPDREKVLRYIGQPDNPAALSAYLTNKKDLRSDPMSSDYLKMTINPKYTRHLSILLHHGADPTTEAVYTAAIVRANRDVIALLFSHGMRYKKRIIKPSFSETFKEIITWCNVNYDAFHRLWEYFELLNQQLKSDNYDEAVDTYYQIERIINDSLPDDISSDLYSYPLEQYALKLQVCQRDHDRIQERMGSEYQKLL